MAAKKQGGGIAGKTARRTTNATKTMRERAAAMQERFENQRTNMISQYGLGLSGQITTSMRPVALTAQAAIRDTRAAVRQAKQGQDTAAASDALYRRSLGALKQANAAQLQRTEEGMAPQLVSAQQAIKDAEAYAARLGVDMKQMDWSARAAIAQSILDQNFQLTQMQFASQLELEQQKALFELQNEQAEKEELKGAPAVVNSVNTAMPEMIKWLENTDFENPPEGKSMIDLAKEFGASHAMDPLAAGVLADVAYKLAAGKGSHTGANGLVNGDWVVNTVQNSVLQLYPSYVEAEDTIYNALRSGYLYTALTSSGPENPSTPGAPGLGRFYG